MNSDEIRQQFINFFVERGHLQVEPLGLVPADPGITTLFTIAGMQKMIPYFMGRDEPPSKRMVTVQRVIRTVDIEEVGDDTHLTFYEMLGNFSVGDYFKREAIHYTWDFLTHDMGISGDRWWATIYPGDEVARQAWLEVGMPPERIVETDKCWWDQGPVGPAGTDSEIHYDRGVEFSCGRENCRPEDEDCDRFIETWNDVFMEYYQDHEDRRPLPWKNIDTGMGFERLTAIVQGKNSPYETDIFTPIMAATSQASGKEYQPGTDSARSFRIIADHSRAIAFLIADGVMPAAEGRGYVLRRLLRRAVLHGQLLGISGAFLTKPVGAAIDVLGSYYHELADRRRRVLDMVGHEEERFLQTLNRGLSIFDEMAARASADGNVISGRDAFLLSDTYGFPLELTMELATERRLTVDEPGYTAALQEQRERARAGRKETVAEVSPETYVAVAEKVSPTVFTGYEELTTTANVAALLAGNEPVGQAVEGEDVDIILTATPFYAESGGQVGDIGLIRGGSGVAQVQDTQRPHTAVVVHRARVIEGSLSVGDVVEATVDAERRLHILPHHSGTHLLHKALQEVLGPEATQAGSLVAPDRLRFDFRWPGPVTDEQIQDIQDRVNAAIWANLPVRTEIKPYDEAVREGAMNLFEGKYGSHVRVISMGEWSKELCGGTHVNATGDIGLFLITAESGIGSGIRRIEAVAGAAAYRHAQEMRETLEGVASVLDTRPDDILSRARHLVAEERALQKRIEDLTQRLARREAEDLVRRGLSVDGFTVVADRVAAENADQLKATTDAVRSQLERGIVLLGSVVNGKAQYVMAVTPNLAGTGFGASQLLREAARTVGGGAGGTPEFATGGGSADKLDDVLRAAVEIIKEKADS
ncbi:MAG TPA: alanine--tRNA ligase [Chloroflexota bacterium]|nr:alanine--tRNA ligase [Chloroflexota bacterium]